MNPVGDVIFPGKARASTRAFLTACRRLAGRVWTFAQLRRRAPPRAEAETWARRLEEEKLFLLSLVRGMETEFLATGDGLGRLAAQLGEIQSQCQSLSDLTLGQSQDAAVQFAFQLLKKAEDLVLASYDQYDHVFATFTELQQRLAQLSRQHDELMRVLLPLSFITLSFRIEASRHPVEVQQAFSTLAASVNRTVNEVRLTLERQFAEIAASERIARSLIGQISASVREHRQEAAATLETSRRQLHALSDSLVRCQAGTMDLAQLNQAVNRHIGDLVLAQQCQDITRQKIEHVGEAMVEMRTHLDDAKTGGPAVETSARQFVFQAGQIQLQQVQNVFDQLNAAAESLQSGIHSLRAEATEAAAAVVKMSSTTLDAQITRQCHAGIGEILGIVQQAVEKIAAIVTAFEPLQASFVDCTRKATTLAGDVRLAGLNAQVFAIQAPDGATLEVLAGRVGVISEQVIQQVEQMGAALTHTAEMINNLRQRLEDFQVLGRAEEEVLTAESVLSQKKLTDLETAIPVLIQGVTRQQETFAQSVQKVLARIRFPEAVAQASARSLGFFQDLVAWSHTDGANLEDKSDAARKLDRLKANYTMASERDTHAAALQPAPATTPAIELFEDLDPAPPKMAGPPEPGTPPAAPSADQPRPADLPVSESNPPPASLPGAEPPAPGPGLGENVELF
jgi:hypothetical protein